MGDCFRGHICSPWECHRSPRVRGEQARSTSDCRVFQRCHCSRDCPCCRHRCSCGSSLCQRCRRCCRRHEKSRQCRHHERLCLCCYHHADSVGPHSQALWDAVACQRPWRRECPRGARAGARPAAAAYGASCSRLSSSCTRLPRAASRAIRGGAPEKAIRGPANRALFGSTLAGLPLLACLLPPPSDVVRKPDMDTIWTK